MFALFVFLNWSIFAPLFSTITTDNREYIVCEKYNLCRETPWFMSFVWENYSAPATLTAEILSYLQRNEILHE